MSKRDLLQGGGRVPAKEGQGEGQHPPAAAPGERRRGLAARARTWFADRDEPDGSASRAGSGCGERPCARAPHSRASSEISARSKSTTPVSRPHCFNRLALTAGPNHARTYQASGTDNNLQFYQAMRVRSVELTEWRNGGPRQYLDWGAPAGVAASHAHPAACARMPKAAPCTAVPANNGECEAFTGSPRSDNYRLEFARGVPRSPRTPRAPRLLPAPRSPSTSGSELSLRQPIRISEPDAKEQEEPAIVPTLRPARPARTACATLAA
ncbi:hypothetical protein EVAR_80376_1 [Eumeta japonica]|uniref:Uncharacterized protein n=1 Tax=Eumeta variegata TaxID=151549 RepID=A0A4C1VK54_EUMVA|nr:hypothetical protein EVAR_80376_1 [Eumeta japonica]